MKEIYTKLLDHYGPRGWWPLSSRTRDEGFDGKGYHPGRIHVPTDEKERFEIAVGAILTQNTAWRNVRPCIDALSQAGLMSPQVMLDAEQDALEDLVRSSGYYRQKAKKLKIISRFFAEEQPVSRDALLALWGVGEETADSILLYAFGRPAAVIDAYSRRIFSRYLGAALCDAEIRQSMESVCDGKDENEQVIVLNEYHALLVELGKNACQKRNPDCSNCPLGFDCRYPAGLIS